MHHLLGLHRDGVCRGCRHCVRALPALAAPSLALAAAAVAVAAASLALAAAALALAATALALAATALAAAALPLRVGRDTCQATIQQGMDCRCTDSG